MDLVIASGTALRHFTRAISCLTKFGEEIHVSAAPRELKLSSINPSRSAFAAVTFPLHFFAKYQVRVPRGENVLSFSVVGKALLSPLRPRSANSIETCSISVVGEEPTQAYRDDEDDDTTVEAHAAAQCRIVIRLFCQHGVIKTHRLTYSTGSAALYPRASRDSCTSHFVASSRILREWTDHFHLRSGSAGGGSDEISFDLGDSSCRLRSFGVDTSSAHTVDSLAARPISTELSISISDFDRYEVLRPSVITFALKEFKSIIALADTVPATIDAACARGGEPILLLVNTDGFKAEFVLATTDFDGDEQAGGSHQQQQPRAVVRDKVKEERRPLFNRAETTQEPSLPPRPRRREDEDADEEDEEYGGGMDDFGDAAFAQIDQLTQDALSQRPGPSAPPPLPFGPTQAGERREVKKQKKWNLLDDDGGASPSP